MECEHAPPSTLTWIDEAKLDARWESALQGTAGMKLPPERDA